MDNSWANHIQQNEKKTKKWGGGEMNRIVAHDVAKISQLIVCAICTRALKRYFDIIFISQNISRSFVLLIRNLGMSLYNLEIKKADNLNFLENWSHQINLTQRTQTRAHTHTQRITFRIYLPNVTDADPVDAINHIKYYVEWTVYNTK